MIRKVVAFLLFFAPADVWAQAQRGESSFPVGPVGAQVEGVGLAGAALNGLEFLPLNPSAFGSDNEVFAAKSHSRTGAEDMMFAASVSTRFGSVAASARRRDWGDLAEDLGVSGVTASETNVGVTYATPSIGGVARVGVGVHSLEADYVGNQMHTTAFDVGLNLRARFLSLGAAMLNCGPGLGDEPSRSPLPRRLRAGMAATFTRGASILRAVSDASVGFSGDNRVTVASGIEFERLVYHAFSATVRIGMHDVTGERTARVGGGIALEKLHIDVAQATGIGLDGGTTMSVSFKW